MCLHVQARGLKVSGMEGIANPNLPCCSSCGDEHPEEAMVLYRFELICPTCKEDHDSKCAECGKPASVNLADEPEDPRLCAICRWDKFEESNRAQSPELQRD